MPGGVPPVPDERSALLGYLAQQRLVLRIAAYGLTDDQARETPTRSSLSIGGLIKHVATIERGWIDIVLQRGGGTPEDYVANFRLGPDETLASVLSLYDEVAARTEQVMADIADLGQA